MDIRFSIALHVMVMISESKELMTSEKIAKSVQTNSSYIRKVMSSLKKSELIKSRQGVIGIELAKRKEEITLFDIYRSVQETEWVTLFDIHKNSNTACPVGKYIEKTLSPTFYEIETEIVTKLKEDTLADLICRMKEKVIEESEKTR